jgi:L-threonylcarbamoyladenylate synthase
MAEIGKDILKAKALLEQGRLVAIPTETVYGLAGNALDIDAVTKIFVAKNRPSFDPLIVHVSNLQSIENYAIEVPEKAFELMKRFWPGPLTVLLQKKDIIPDLVTSGLERVGLRCPDHPITLELLNTLSFPLAAPSANPFGYVSPTTPQHVNDQLGDKIEYILDGGACKVGIESTIIGFEKSVPLIYRLGGLRLEDIESVIGKVHVSANSSSHPQAPGQLLNHYAPGKKVVVGDIGKVISENASKSIGVLSFMNVTLPSFIREKIVLSPSGNLNEAAQRLFSALRDLDESSIDMIVTELVPDVGLGRAINDRLKRASA